jgi:hypothetical protein
VLVLKGHGLECQDRFARFVHRFNLFFGSARRTHRAQLTSRVYYNWHSIHISGCHPTNASNEGACLIGVADADGASVASLTIAADNDVEIGVRVKKETGAATHDDVAAASGIVKQRALTDDRVEAAGAVV